MKVVIDSIKQVKEILGTILLVGAMLGWFLNIEIEEAVSEAMKVHIATAHKNNPISKEQISLTIKSSFNDLIKTHEKEMDKKISASEVKLFKALQDHSHTIHPGAASIKDFRDLHEQNLLLRQAVESNAQINKIMVKNVETKLETFENLIRSLIKDTKENRLALNNEQP